MIILEKRWQDIIKMELGLFITNVSEKPLFFTLHKGESYEEISRISAGRTLNLELVLIVIQNSFEVWGGGEGVS